MSQFADFTVKQIDFAASVIDGRTVLEIDPHGRSGKAVPASDSVGRQPEVKASGVRSGVPLNFKVDPDFRRRFRQRAAEVDLKLNELLREVLDAWEERKGLR